MEMKYSGQMDKTFRIWQNLLIDWIKGIKERELLKMSSRILIYAAG